MSGGLAAGRGANARRGHDGAEGIDDDNSGGGDGGNEEEAKEDCHIVKDGGYFFLHD